jgi:hypothetical protein
VPFASALFVAVVAAGVSYWVSWRFKRADVNRDNGVRAADLVDEAERIVAWPDHFDAQPEGGGSATLRLLQQARVRAEPLDDPVLRDRFQTAVAFSSELVTWPEPSGAARHWLREALANVREGLVPHLAAPTLSGRIAERKRSFPTSTEYNAMPKNDRDGRDLLDALVDWRANRAE